MSRPREQRNKPGGGMLDISMERDDEPMMNNDDRIGRPLSILLVDDDPLVREVTALLLSEAGHHVLEAADGQLALEVLCGGTKVDLLITDINMPRMDGLELVKHTRRQWPDLPVLLVSGRPQPPGGEPFMAKPFGWESLLRAVGRVTPAESEGG